MDAQTEVTAIDVLLEPDGRMVAAAEKVNTHLLRSYPAGFPLDSAHRPHITVLQTYVRTAGLDDLFDALGRALADWPVVEWLLWAAGYYYLPWQGIGVAGIVVQPTTAMLALQQAWIDAAAPFAAEKGDATAFVTTTDDPEINQPTMDYVASFVSNSTAKNYNPHVSVGIGLRTELDELVAAPFKGFEFSPIGASVYQLGNMGTAARLLHTWP